MRRESVIFKQERRNRLLEQERSLIECAERADRDFTPGEQRQSDDLLAQIERLTGAIDQQKRDEQADRDAAPPPDRRTRPDHRQQWEDRGRGIPGPRSTTSMYRDEQLEAFARGEDGHRASLTIDLSEAAEERAHRRDLSAGAATAGGHTVPTGFVNRLYEHLIESSGVRQANPTVLTTGAGEDLVVPKTTSHSTASIIAEGATIGEDDPDFDAVTLGAFKYGNLVKVTSELLTDTSVDLTAYLSRSFGRAIGDASGAHFISGTGTGQPEGLLTAASAGVTAASTTDITADELLNLYFSVIPAYRRNGYWLMTDATWAKVRKLRTDEGGAGTGDYLVGPLGAAADLRLMGRPVIIDPNVDEAAADAKTVLFGDLAGYYIRQVQQVRFERSDHIHFDSDLVAFRVLHRLDGRLVDTSGAVKYLQQAAT